MCIECCSLGCAQSRAHCTSFEAPPCVQVRELEEEIEALAVGREHRRALKELMNKKELVGDLFNNLRLTRQRLNNSARANSSTINTSSNGSSSLQGSSSAADVQASASSPGYSMLSEADEQCINSTLAQLLMVMESLDTQIGASWAQHQSMNLPRRRLSCIARVVHHEAACKHQMNTCIVLHCQLPSEEVWSAHLEACRCRAGPMLEEDGKEFNERWGYLSRAGLNDKSQFTRQIEKYAGVTLIVRSSIASKRGSTGVNLYSLLVREGDHPIECACENESLLAEENSCPSL